MDLKMRKVSNCVFFLTFALVANIAKKEKGERGSDNCATENESFWGLKMML